MVNMSGVVLMWQYQNGYLKYISSVVLMMLHLSEWLKYMFGVVLNVIYGEHVWCGAYWTLQYNLLTMMGVGVFWYIYIYRIG